MKTYSLWRLKLNFKFLFSSLSQLQKVEFYLIPLLVIFLIILNFPPTKNEFNNSLKPPTNNAIKINKMEVSSFYEQAAKISNVKICSLKIEENNEIFVKFTGDINSLIHFLKIVEKVSTINLLNFINTEEAIAIEGVFQVNSFKNLILESPVNKNSLINPFFIVSNEISKIKETPIQNQLSTTEQDLLSIKKEIPKFLQKEEIIQKDLFKKQDTNEIFSKPKTIAIVGEFVFLDKEWLKIGDSYKDYTITNISNKSIEFSKNGEKRFMEMFDE